MNKYVKTEDHHLKKNEDTHLYVGIRKILPNTELGGGGKQDADQYL